MVQGRFGVLPADYKDCGDTDDYKDCGDTDVSEEPVAFIYLFIFLVRKIRIEFTLKMETTGLS